LPVKDRGVAIGIERLQEGLPSHCIQWKDATIAQRLLGRARTTKFTVAAAR
jgi:hypothetical protein